MSSNSKLKTSAFAASHSAASARRLQNSKLQKLPKLLLNWFSQNARDLPWRRTRDPYAIWVSEIMLQQTQVKTVMPYWERWMRELPTIKAAANASPDKIHKLWEGLGYYTRVRNLQKAAKQIVAQHDSRLKIRRRRGNEAQTKNKLETPHVVSYKFPDNFADVLALPGIGRYTAGAICSIAFDQPVPILDGNVIRLLTRVFGIAKNPREKKTNTQLWQLAENLVGRAVPSPLRRGRDRSSRGFAQANTVPYHSFLNQSLMELGALVCTPRNPKCQICPIKKLCDAFRENRIEELPNLGKRTAATTRRFIAFVVEHRGRFIVRQRPAGIVNAHLWEFPNVECVKDKADAGQIFKTMFGVKPFGIRPLCTVKHSITRYRITLEAFHVSFGGPSSTRPKNVETRRRGTPPSDIGIWLSPAKLDSLAFTSAHRKILERLNPA